MYIVNTSFFVDPSVYNAWFDILTTKFLPFLKNQECEIVSFARILSNEPAEHYAFSLITKAEDMPGYQRYMDELLPEYDRLAQAMFGERVMALTTLMKKIDHE